MILAPAIATFFYFLAFTVGALATLGLLGGLAALGNQFAEGAKPKPSEVAPNVRIVRFSIVTIALCGAIIELIRTNGWLS